MPTAGLILTFESPQPLPKLKVWHMSMTVRPYFKNPQRCFCCQKYGHSSQWCTNWNLLPMWPVWSQWQNWRFAKNVQSHWTMFRQHICAAGMVHGPSFLFQGLFGKSSNLLGSGCAPMKIAAQAQVRQPPEEQGGSSRKLSWEANCDHH